MLKQCFLYFVSNVKPIIRNSGGKLMIKQTKNRLIWKRLGTRLRNYWLKIFQIVKVYI